jgi:hypothetical protein
MGSSPASSSDFCRLVKRELLDDNTVLLQRPLLPQCAANATGLHKR